MQENINKDGVLSGVPQQRLATCLCAQEQNRAVHMSLCWQLHLPDLLGICLTLRHSKLLRGSSKVCLQPLYPVQACNACC